MTPVVTIIGNVIAKMKINFSGMTISPTDGSKAVEFTNVSKTQYDKAFIGLRFKLVVSNGDIYYGTISRFTDDDPTEFFGTLDINFIDPGIGTTWAVTQVLNYHYGHLQEIRNTFVQWTTKASVKREQFPAIVLVQDFPEVIDLKELTREVTLRLFILTDTQQHFVASERYTYSFIPILYPLEALFLKKLASSNAVSNYEATHTRYDRLKWGTLKADEGTATNIFNDFIDAIELENLKLNIINTC